VARSDSGAVTIAKMSVDLGDIAADTASSLAKTASERGITIAIDPEPTPLLGDPSRLRQLVLILVDNALGHSPRGSTVTVTTRRDGGRVRLTVDDEGKGLRDEDLPRVFERFWRGAEAPPGGAGLGLSIAQWIVTAHGGTIRATNREPSGARFVVEIPASG
jgi:signal transduction histidine kinase